MLHALEVAVVTDVPGRVDAVFGGQDRSDQKDRRHNDRDQRRAAVLVRASRQPVTERGGGTHDDRDLSDAQVERLGNELGRFARAAETGSPREVGSISTRKGPVRTLAENNAKSACLLLTANRTDLSPLPRRLI